MLPSQSDIQAYSGKGPEMDEPRNQVKSIPIGESINTANGAAQETFSVNPQTITASNSRSMKTSAPPQLPEFFNGYNAFSTKRLKPMQQKTKHGDISILSNGSILVDFSREPYLILISADSKWVQLCDRQKSSKTSTVADISPYKTYPSAKLPPNLSKIFAYAAKFVDLVRSKTPKIVFYSPQAKCLLMENSPQPDFEMNFYSGLKVHHNSRTGRIVFKVPQETSTQRDHSGSGGSPEYTVHEYDISEGSDNSILDLPDLLISAFKHLQECLRQCLDAEKSAANDESEIGDNCTSEGAKSSFPLILKSSNICSNTGDRKNLAYVQVSGQGTSPAPSVLAPNSLATFPTASCDGRMDVQKPRGKSVSSTVGTASTLYTPESKYRTLSVTHLTRSHTTPVLVRGGSATSTGKIGLLMSDETPSLISTTAAKKTSVAPTVVASSVGGGSNGRSRQVFLDNVGWCSRDADGRFVMLFNDGVHVIVDSRDQNLVWIDATSETKEEVRYKIDKALPQWPVRGGEVVYAPPLLTLHRPPNPITYTSTAHDTSILVAAINHAAAVLDAYTTALQSTDEEKNNRDDAAFVPFESLEPIFSLVSNLVTANPFLSATALENNAVGVLTSLSNMLNFPDVASSASRLCELILQNTSSNNHNEKVLHTLRITQSKTQEMNEVNILRHEAHHAKIQAPLPRGRDFYSKRVSTVRHHSSESSLRARGRECTPSPSKAHPLQFPALSKLPRLPNVTPSYHFIHLSPIDEETILEFEQTASKPVIDEIERKLFHILTNDFGAQVFLQKPHLFRLVLSGLVNVERSQGDSSAEHSERFAQSLDYVSTLIRGLTAVFRRFVDDPSRLGSNTPISATTPNVSTLHFGGLSSVGLQGRAEPRVDHLEMSNNSENRASVDACGPMSVPEAFNEVFVAVVEILSSGRLKELHGLDNSSIAWNLLRILDSILSSVIFHLEEIRDLDLENGDGFTDAWCIEYVIRIANCAVGRGMPFLKNDSCRAEDQDGFGERSVWINSVLRLCCEFVCGLKKVCLDYPRFQWASARILLDVPVQTNFVSAFMYGMVPEITEDTALSIFHVLVHPYLWIRQAAYNALLDMCESFQGHADGALHIHGLSSVLGNRFVQFIISRDCAQENNEQLRATALSIVQNAIDLSLNKIGWLSFVQAFSDENESLIGIWEHHTAKIALEQNFSLSIRGLFHRSESVRVSSFNFLLRKWTLMDNTIPSAKSANILMFNQSVLAKNTNVGMYNSGDRLTVSDFDRLLTQLSMKTDYDADFIAQAMDKLSSCVFDSSILSHARNANILKVLIGCLADKRGWLQHAQSMMQTFKVCRVLASFELSSIRKTINLWDLVSPEYLFNINELVRFEFAKLLFVLLFNHYDMVGDSLEVKSALGIIDNGTIYLFEGLAEKYSVYGPCETVSVKNLENLQPSDKVISGLDLLFQNAASGKIPTLKYLIRDWVEFQFERVVKSGGHNEFARNMNALFRCLIVEWEYDLFLNFDVVTFFERFLLVHPANQADEDLLVEVIEHLSRGIATSPTFFSGLQNSLFKSLSMLTLPILQSSTHIKSAEEKLHKLPGELMLLLQNYLRLCSAPSLGAILKNTNCLEVLINYSYYVFSYEFKDARMYSYQFACLQCLEEFTKIPEILHLVSGAKAASFVQLLVSILGYSQQNYTNSTDGNAFTYQDRSIYSHWLFQGDIDWLIVLLHDDEIAIQKSGLGILGNMILIKESYPLICAKIPQFLDMAFSYVLDAERNYTLRKEAVLIVNNFLITFCHDNKLNQFSLLPSSDESLAELNQLSRESVSGNDIDDLFELFEHCGFFEHLKSVISDCGTFSVVFMDALSALLLNLCIVAPKIFFVKMGGSDTWDGLLMFLESTYTLPNNPLLGVSSDNSSVLVTFRESQYKTCFSHFIESTQYNILSLALILLSENDDVLNAYVVQNLHILDHIKGLASYLSTEHMWTSQTTSKVISVSFCILAEVVKLPSLCDNVKLSSWLATDGNALNILQGCVSIIAASGGLDPELVKVSCLLLARLLSMHFGGSLDLELQNYLAFKSVDSEVSVGEQLAVLLFSLTSEMIEDFDLVHVESVRIGLQILYAHFQPAKRRAISSGCLGEILERMCGILKSCKTSRATEKQKIVLHLSLTLVRHILVNSSEEKAYAHNRGLIKILSEILCFQEANDLILGEALLCLNNSLANHHQSESWLVRHPTAGGLTVVECVVKAMKLNSHFSAVFEASVAVLRMFVLQNPVRNSLVKVIPFGKRLMSKILKYIA
ncbi:Serine/threonine-protein kinase plk4 [Entophlyctis luteolus]|nr:Serine/threonine-protein kinase plk4 [Entophlyctis luteolus]